MQIEITQEIVRELLNYDSATGLLIWKRRDRRWFKDKIRCQQWNTRYAGKRAFNCSDGHGYLIGSLFHKKYSAHRIIWLWMTGRWPTIEVDHENHDRADNRWENLFEATHRQNGLNVSCPKNNTSGRIGVSLTRNGKFRAHIMVNDHQHHLGNYDTLDGASDARKSAERKYGFHARHGEVR